MIQFFLSFYILFVFFAMCIDRSPKCISPNIIVFYVCNYGVCVYLQTKTKDCSLCASVVVVVLLLFFFIHCEIVIFHRPNIEDDPTRFCFSLKTEKNLSLTGVCVVVFLVLFCFLS